MFKTLQMGRAIAALGVCAFHLSLAFNDPRFGNAPLFSKATQFGRFGVDFFFALSGFIIMYAHRQDVGRVNQLPRFLLKRFVRIYPLYWLLTVLAVASALLNRGSGSISGIDAISIFSLVHFSSVSTPLVPAWTLFHEIFFYAAFSLLILDLRIGILACVVWVGTIFLLGTGPELNPRTISGMALLPVNLCFFSGIFAYFISRRLALLPSAFFTILGAALLVFGFAFIDEPTQGLQFALVMSLAFALLISGVVSLDRRGLIRNIAFISLVGDASYALYLIHPLTQTALLKAAYLVHVTSIIGLPALFGAVMAGTLLISIAIHLLIEKPMNGYLARRLIAPKNVRPKRGLTN